MGVMLVALGLIAVAAYVAWNQISETDGTSSIDGTGFTANVRIGGPFTLTNHRGEKVTDSTYRGRFLFVYFGYGYCPDVCPTELANMAAALDMLGDKAIALQPLFVTVDPERDSVEFLSEYVGQFHPKFVGLTGTPAEISAVAKSYRVFYRKANEDNSTEYLVDHSSFVYLMGPNGEFLTMFRGATDPAAMAKTIAAYIDKRKAGT
ncbi:MAG: SCO family protein [Rickettsiales bacterium]